MKYLFFLFISIQICNAQGDHVLRIVSYRGDVSIDNISTHSGQLVFSSSQKLVVGRKSYAYVLTPKGHSMKLEYGSYSIEGIEELIISRKQQKRAQTGAVTREMPYPLVFAGLDMGEQRLQLLGDSTYWRWKKNSTSKVSIKLPYRFGVFSIFEDVLYKEEVNEAAVRIDLWSVANEEPSVLVSINEHASPRITVKFIEADESNIILEDMSRVATDPVQKSILDLVIYDGNDLILDLMFNLDKISTIDTTSLPNDLKNYLSLLKIKYEFN